MEKECECYEEEVQPYRKADYKPIIYMSSEEVEQIHLGDGTETLSTRIWLNNKPLLLHNIYRTGYNNSTY